MKASNDKVVGKKFLIQCKIHKMHSTSSKEKVPAIIADWYGQHFGELFEDGITLGINF